MQSLSIIAPGVWAPSSLPSLCMNIAIVGAGVCGVTTAHELLNDGHTVTLYEKRGTPAEEASFAPAGLVSTAWALAWAGPEHRLHAPWAPPGPGVRWRAGLDRNAWRWWRRWRREERRRGNDALLALRDLIDQGLQRQIELTAELDLDHDRSDDLLVLLSDAREAAGAQPAIDRLRGLGLELRTVSADEARAIEPALNPTAPLHSAVHLRGPGVANCREWTMLMRHRIARLGGALRLRTGVTGLRPDGLGWRLSASDGSDAHFDAVVLCAGVGADELLGNLGLPTPWTVLWSHSLSAGLREPMDAPVSAVLDLKSRIAITRLGQRVRASGGADLGGSAAGTDPASLRRLGQVMSHWFPAAARFSGPQASIQSWRGALVMSEDGLPCIGASRLPGLWLNLAHGAAGWAMACGAARHLANAIAHPSAEGPATAFAPSRVGL